MAEYYARRGATRPGAATGRRPQRGRSRASAASTCSGSFSGSDFSETRRPDAPDQYTNDGCESDCIPDVVSPATERAEPVDHSASVGSRATHPSCAARGVLMIGCRSGGTSLAARFPVAQIDQCPYRACDADPGLELECLPQAPPLCGLVCCQRKSLSTELPQCLGLIQCHGCVPCDLSRFESARPRTDAAELLRAALDTTKHSAELPHVTPVQHKCFFGATMSRHQVPIAESIVEPCDQLVRGWITRLQCRKLREQKFTTL